MFANLRRGFFFCLSHPCKHRTDVIILSCSRKWWTYLRKFPSVIHAKPLFDANDNNTASTSYEHPAAVATKTAEDSIQLYKMQTGSQAWWFYLQEKRIHTHTHSLNPTHTHSTQAQTLLMILITITCWEHKHTLRVLINYCRAHIYTLPYTHTFKLNQLHSNAVFFLKAISESRMCVCVGVCVCVCVLRRMLLASAESLKLQSPMMCGCGFGDQCLSSQEGEILFCWDWHMSKLLVCPSPAPSIKICKAEAPNLKRWSYISISKQNSCLFKLLAVYEQFYLCCAQ